DARERAQHVADVLPVAGLALDAERGLELRARLVERAFVEEEQRDVDPIDGFFAPIADLERDVERGAVAALLFVVAVLPVVNDAEVSEDAHHRDAIAELALHRERAFQDATRPFDSAL